LASKPTSIEDTTQKSNELSSSLPSSELNISEGLAGNLVQCIIIQSSKEACERGLSIAEITAKRHETVKKNLENYERRCMAGLLASLGQFSLGLNALQHQRNAKQIEEDKKCQKALWAKDIYDVLLAKVQAIKVKNLPPKKWMVSELNKMIQWYKWLEDGAMPAKKEDKQARYHNIKGWGDPPMPTLVAMEILPLPPLAGSEPELNIPAEVDDASRDQGNDDDADALLLFEMEV
jgi:hypothetical protein